eukprot:3091687-Heterocapsa_arctica.AAC.1
MHHKRNTYKVLRYSKKEQHVDNSMYKHRNADNAFQGRHNINMLISPWMEIKKVAMSVIMH